MKKINRILLILVIIALYSVTVGTAFLVRGTNSSAPLRSGQSQTEPNRTETVAESQTTEMITELQATEPVNELQSTEIPGTYIEITEKKTEINNSASEVPPVTEAITEKETEKITENAVASVSRSLSSFEAEVFNLVNNYRTENGLAALSNNTSINFLASIRAEEVSRSWSHTRPDGRRPYSVFEDYGFTLDGHYGENLAKKFSTPEGVVNGWINSDSHRALMSDPEMAGAGVAVYTGSDGIIYVSMLFKN